MEGRVWEILVGFCSDEGVPPRHPIPTRRGQLPPTHYSPQADHARCAKPLIAEVPPNSRPCMGRYGAVFRFHFSWA